MTRRPQLDLYHGRLGPVSKLHATVLEPSISSFCDTEGCIILLMEVSSIRKMSAVCYKVNLGHIHQGNNM